MFTPENDLERALVRAAQDPSARAPFLKTLLDSELAFALVEGGGKGKPGDGYEVPEVEADGQGFVPVFTAESRVRTMFGDEKMMIVRQTFRQIVEQVSDANFVLNPGSDYGREIMAADVRAMLAGDFAAAASGAGEDDEGAETPLPAAIGRPSPAPTHLTGPLAKLFAGIPEVRAAHIGQSLFPDSYGTKRLVIGVAADGDVDAVFDRMGEVLDQVARPTDVIDFVPVPGSTLDGYFERDANPFYRKASA